MRPGERLCWIRVRYRLRDLDPWDFHVLASLAAQKGNTECLQASTKDLGHRFGTDMVFVCCFLLCRVMFGFCRCLLPAVFGLTSGVMIWWFSGRGVLLV